MKPPSRAESPLELLDRVGVAPRERLEGWPKLLVPVDPSVAVEPADVCWNSEGVELGLPKVPLENEVPGLCCAALLKKPEAGLLALAPEPNRPEPPDVPAKGFLFA